MSKTIREKAEALLREEYPVENLVKDKHLPQILHELQVHQIELELQNDELRRTQEVLQQTQKKYFDLYNLAPVGYVTLDNKGVILDINLAGAEMLGRERRWLNNRPLLGFLDSESRQVFFEYLDTLAQARMSQTCELRLQPHSGVRPIYVQVEGVADQEEGHRCYRLILTDITQRKAAEMALAEERTSLSKRVEERTAELSKINDELTRASRLKDEFLANMSHELRTPLHTILGHSEILDEQIYGALNEKQRKAVGLIAKSGHHLLSLINDILDLSKVESGKLDLYISPVVIIDICRECLEFIDQSAADKHIRLDFQANLQNERFEADEMRLKQILINLLVNAVKFTQEGGQVGLLVTDTEQAEAIRFTVWDTGIGIPRDEIERMFQPFVQVDGGLNRRIDGTGLGLTLVQKLICLHRGKIKVESELGVGSRFTVSLPRFQDAIV